MQTDFQHCVGILDRFYFFSITKYNNVLSSAAYTHLEFQPDLNLTHSMKLQPVHR